MPRALSVDSVRDEFLYQIEVARNLVTAVRPLAAIHPNSGPSLHPKHVSRTIELAFMGVCSAWEEFLERSLVRYLAGATTSGGYSPALRVGKCANLKHAYQVLTGKPHYDPESAYMTWTNPIAVVDLAAVFLTNGGSFSAPLTRENDRLKKAVLIRNRVAHASIKCKSDFHDAANAVMQRAKGTPLGQGYRVGDLLNSSASPFFGTAVSATGLSVFDAYMRLFEQAAGEIVP